MMKIYIARSGHQTGPYSREQINAMLRSNSISLTDLSWHQGLTSWLPLQQVLGLGSSVPTKNSDTASKVLKFSAIGCGGLLACFVGLIVIVTIFSNGEPRRGNSIPSSKRIEDVLAHELQQGFTTNRQRIFEGMHPVGTANSVVVHEVKVDEWKNGRNTNDFTGIQKFTVRYTLYWSGPITKDGYTKVSQTFDAESQRYVSAQILSTNGITNANAGEAAGAVFWTWLQYEAQKAGAERATEKYYGR